MKAWKIISDEIKSDVSCDSWYSCLVIVEFCVKTDDQSSVLLTSEYVGDEFAWYEDYPDNSCNRSCLITAWILSWHKICTKTTSAHTIHLSPSHFFLFTNHWMFFFIHSYNCLNFVLNISRSKTINLHFFNDITYSILSCIFVFILILTMVQQTMFVIYLILKTILNSFCFVFL